MFIATVTAKEVYELPVVYNISFDEKCNKILNQSRKED